MAKRGANARPARCGWEDPRPLRAMSPTLPARRSTRHRSRTLSKLDPKSLPAVSGNPAHRRLRCRHRQIHLHRPELFRPRRRDRRNRAAGADHLHEGNARPSSGPNDDVLIPRGSEKTDWEVELGVVIGRKAKYVTEAEALDYVAGYCVVHDVVRARLPDRAPGPVDQGQELRHVRADRPVAGDQGRGARTRRTSRCG